MRDSDSRLRHELLDPGGDFINARHPVVDVEDLAFAHHFAANGSSDLLIGIRPDVGQNRVTLFWRGGQGRGLADSSHRHF